MINIVILAQGSAKTQDVENIIRLAAKQIGAEVQINRTNNFAAYSNFAISPAQTPIVFINGSLEFAGRVPDLNLLKLRLTELKRLTP